MIEPLPWLILLLPLLSAVLITLFLQRNARFSAILSVGAVLVSFFLTLDLLAEYFSGGAPEIHAQWLRVGRLNIEFGMRFDALSMLMLLVVTGVGAAIHIYSVGYMKADAAYSRFFACLSLFTFSMIGVVVSNNFFQMFIFWELVGLCSYLLIGFWYRRPRRGGRRQKGVPDQSPGRLRLFHRHRSGLGNRREPLFRRASSNKWPATPNCSTRRRRWWACSFFAGRWANQPNFPCTSGCPTPWKAPRR